MCVGEIFLLLAYYIIINQSEFIEISLFLCLLPYKKFKKKLTTVQILFSHMKLTIIPHKLWRHFMRGLQYNLFDCGLKILQNIASGVEFNLKIGLTFGHIWSLQKTFNWHKRTYTTNDGQ